MRIALFLAATIVIAATAWAMTPPSDQPVLQETEIIRMPDGGAVEVPVD